MINYKHDSDLLSENLGLSKEEFSILAECFHNGEKEALRELTKIMEEVGEECKGKELLPPEEIVNRANAGIPPITKNLEYAEIEAISKGLTLEPAHYVTLGFMASKGVQKRNSLFSHMLHKLFQGELIQNLIEFLQDITEDKDGGKSED